MIPCKVLRVRSTNLSETAKWNHRSRILHRLRGTGAEGGSDKQEYGGYTSANAVEFLDMMAQRMEWRRYGDKEYVPHVLQYYAFGRIPTGIGNQSIVQAALSQEGNKGGYPYWSWYGYNSRVSWCADKCGYIENGTILKFSSCASSASWFKGKGRFKDRGYTPSPGYIIFFDWGAGVHHVGIVVDVTNGTVNTIEGNSSDAVRRRSYRLVTAGFIGMEFTCFHWEKVDSDIRVVDFLLSYSLVRCSFC